MAFENIIREMDKRRNEDDMALSFKFQPRSLNDYGRRIEIKERALKKAKTTTEYQEVEEAVRLEKIESSLNNDSEFKSMKRKELTDGLSPILAQDYQEATERYTALFTEYEEKYSAAENELKKLLEKVSDELLPITKELASIEAANDYLFYSDGPYAASLRSGINELIDTDIKPIAKIAKPSIRQQKQPTVGEITETTVYPFLKQRDSKDKLIRNLIEGVYTNE